MTSNWRTALTLAAIFGWAPVSALAQGQVIVVDDNGGLGVDFQTIHEAVANAQEGDTILVKAGVYDYNDGPTTIDIVGTSLSIIAELDQDVQISFLTVKVRDLASNQKVTLRGLIGWASGRRRTAGCQAARRCQCQEGLEMTSIHGEFRSVGASSKALI